MEEIWKSENSLKELVSEDKFKSFDELQTKLNRVLGLGGEFSSPKTVDVPFDGGHPISSTPSSETSSDDNLDYFKKLAEA